ncbi:MAG: tetratricopeptide repeat protein [Bacteroidales bacterium]|nr:tetratricopeptide repeat protein [Bacteroidales bacterium]MBN2821042.1 tetratricopeptide repeat protein [Bacteroidales bacterium]
MKHKRLQIYQTLLILSFTLACLNLFSQNDATGLLKMVDEYKASGNKLELASTYNKLGTIYWQSGKLDKAVDFYKKSVEINEDLGNNNAIRIICGYLGLIHLEAEKYNDAIVYFKRSLELNKSIGKTNEIISDYYNLASAYQMLRQYDKSSDNANLALAKALETENLEMAKSCNLLLAENYEKTGDSKKSAEHFANYTSLNKHLQTAEMAKMKDEKKQIETQIHQKNKELQTALDTLGEVIEINQEMQLQQSIKELQLKEQDARLEILESKEKLRKTQLFYLSLFLILIVGILVLFFFQSQQRKKANNRLKEQNIKIENQKAEIEKQRDLADKQRKNLTSSIQYARRIQSAVIPKKTQLYEHFNDSFILYRPRDIVSGDFYWFAQKDDLFVLAAADCTGHGVPGAFMSMLGVAFLNEIINKIAVNIHITSLNADEILNQLREKVITSLHQTEGRGDPKDGMDIALCIINTKQKTIQFAGANNPLVIIRNNEVIKIKGDKMPVSIHKRKDVPFSKHEMKLKDGDCLYLFSDGYIDQFGGDEGRKFMSNRFLDLLVKIHQEPMPEQKIILESEYQRWKGDFTQVDDVIVIGLRFGKVTGSKTINWEDKTILIAEDTDINYFLLVEVLKMTKVNIVRAMNGEEAVEMTKLQKIDLVLMDINMPKMSGFEATRLIKEFDKNIPIIIQTAVYQDGEKQAEESGADEFISKPIDLRTFMDKLKHFLN